MMERGFLVLVCVALLFVGVAGIATAQEDPHNSCMAGYATEGAHWWGLFGRDHVSVEARRHQSEGWPFGQAIEPYARCKGEWNLVTPNQTGQ